MKKRLRKWDTRSISMGRRVTIIKLVLSALPLYIMSLFYMPKLIEKKHRSLLCGFLWGGKETEKKVAWVKWDEVCKAEKECGLGIKDLLVFNKALMCKWVWRFLQEKDNLWVKVLKSRFGELSWCRDGERRAEGRRAGWGGGKRR